MTNIDEISSLCSKSFLFNSPSPPPKVDELGVRGVLRRRLDDKNCLYWLPFVEIDCLLKHSYPSLLLEDPTIYQFSDVIASPNDGIALYCGQSGLIINKSFLTRLPRCRRTPYVKQHKIDLPYDSNFLASVDEAVFVPWLLGNNIYDWFSEAHSYIWVFSESFSKEISGLPVIIPGKKCIYNQQLATILFHVIRQAHCFPVFLEDLPDRVFLKKTYVPAQAYCSGVGVSRTYFKSVDSFSAKISRLLPDNLQFEKFVFIAPPFWRRPGQDECCIEDTLEQYLLSYNFSILSSDTRLDIKILAIKHSQLFVCCSLVDFKLLSSLGLDMGCRRIIFLTDMLDVDTALQLRAQEAKGGILKAYEMITNTVDINGNHPIVRWLMSAEDIFDRIRSEAKLLS